MTTALAAAGVEIDPAWKLDGVNLLPYLTEKTSDLPHDSLYWRHGGQWAVRKGPWKLARWLDRRDNDADSKMMEPQLFNLEEDIGETQNRFATEPDIARELQAAYDNWNKDNIPAVKAGNPQGKPRSNKKN
jgi:hypothetical protein